MLVGVLVALVAGALASAFMWWATRRNAFWAMAAAAVFTVLMFAAAVAVAWAIARATYGP